jgi:mannose-6-phosphate isomerase
MELASIKAVPKPWGSTDLRPWSNSGQSGLPIGELWFERADEMAPEPALLLKLLFTEQPLSIQVHPDDDYARSIGLPHGKTEAWYIVSAHPGAQVALGLTRSLTRIELRAAIEHGSIPDLVHWQDVAPDDTLLVPAGTIHAIGAGLVIAEIQQRSDATFRLFDYERHRQLHIDDAVGAAIAAPAAAQIKPVRLSEARRVLEANRYFLLEQIDLPPDSRWELDADGEVWLLVLAGEAMLGPIGAGPGEAVFLEAHSVTVRAGRSGLKGLVAYVASAPASGLLRPLDAATIAQSVERVSEIQEILT